MGRTKVPDFSDFWRAYPLHKARGPAERAWNRLSAGDKQRALAGIPRYRIYCEETGVAFKYAQGWLNDRRWEDEYDNPVEKPTETEAGTVAGTVAEDSLSDMELW